MPNQIKIDFLKTVEAKYGKLKKLPNSLSLFEIGEDVCRVYVRYSKIHFGKKSFYGLRKDDLKQLEGHNSVICFLWDNQKYPLFIPYTEFEEVFNVIEPAVDGQYKSQIYYQVEGTELYIANAGRFNVENYIGWDNLDILIDKSKMASIPELNHSQVQTLIGSIGIHNGYDVWIPTFDRHKLDWNLTQRFNCIKNIPERYNRIMDIIKEVDVLWLRRGSSELSAMYEVEYSTPIYSGLLRFNDLHLIEPNLKTKFSIVSNDLRRTLFLRQINRPTFKMSGLSELCNFLEYKDVYGWFNRISKLNENL